MIFICEDRTKDRTKGEYINLVGKNAEYEEHRKKNNCHWISSNIVQSANKISDGCEIVMMCLSIRSDQCKLMLMSKGSLMGVK